jgi:hypothetical protein
MAFHGTGALRDRPLATALAVVAGLALAGLALPAVPGFDPWGWLVWAREIGGWELDTRGGPSWKPLPVLVGAPLAPLGYAGAELWLLLVRASWLAAPLLVGAVAVRMVPRAHLEAAPGGALAIGAIAAGGVLLLDDPVTPWLRQGATGLSEPLLVVIAIGAFAAWQLRRERTMLALLFGCALLRPEAWLIFGWLAIRRFRSGRDRPALALAAVAIPLLWLVPDLIGSGDALTGADRARAEGPSLAGPPEALGRFVGMPLAVLWIGVAVAVAEGIREGRRQPVALALLAAVWVAQVAALALVGYAGLPRFMAPAAAAACALGAAGYAAAAYELRARPPRTVVAAAAAALALLALGQVGWRVGDLVGDARGVAERAEREREVVALAEAVDGGPLEGCAPVYLGDYLLGPAVAWRLELPLVSVRPLPAERPETGVALVEPGSPKARPVHGPVRHREGGWEAIELGC